MPTYDYTCNHCKADFTKFQSITAEPFAECPSCQQAVRRNMSSGTGIHFKGSGFYVTDYKQKDYKQKQNTDADASAKKTTDASSQKNKSDSDSNKKSSTTTNNKKDKQ